MGRPSNPEIRRALTVQAVDYIIAHGLADLSLRPLAEAIGTSARMLIYHFGSRETLLREVLTELRQRESQRIAEWFQTPPLLNGLGDFLRWYWPRLSAPEAKPVMILIFEIYVMALRDPKLFQEVMVRPQQYWGYLLGQTGVKKPLVEPKATLLAASFRGLLMDLIATGDVDRIDAALQCLIQLIDE